MTCEITDEEFNAALSEIAGPVKTMCEIARSVTEKTGVSLEEMKHHTRRDMAVRARQLLMYKARQQGVTFYAIGRFLNRDHTTIIHGVQRMERAMKEAAS